MELGLLSAMQFFVAGFGFVFLVLVIFGFIRPNNPSADKNSTYECGERPIGSAWMQFNPRFYLVALIFLIFDVEIAFVFPIATIFAKAVREGRGMLALIELLVFMALLLLGLVYVWKKGDLQWVKSLHGQLTAKDISDD